MPRKKRKAKTPRSPEQLSLDLDEAPGVLRQEGATGAGFVIDFNDPAIAGDGHWLRPRRSQSSDAPGGLPGANEPQGRIDRAGVIYQTGAPPPEKCFVVNLDDGGMHWLRADRLAKAHERAAAAGRERYLARVKEEREQRARQRRSKREK